MPRPPAGVEQGPHSSGKTPFATQRDANSDALSDDLAPLDPALALVVHVWPVLPEAVRRQILGIAGVTQTADRPLPPDG